MERYLDLATDLALFAQVVRHGGLSAASRATGIPKSRLSRRITQLEDRLGARLIERSSRRFAVTGFGRQVQAHAEEVAANTAAAVDLASAHVAEPQGLVRVSCPIGLDLRLFEILLPVMRRHPLLRIQILPGNRPVDLIADQVDIALRVRPGIEGEADFQVRPILRSRAILVASPDLAARLDGAGPEALETVPTLSRQRAAGEDRWQLEHIVSGEQIEFRHRPRFATGTFEPLVQAAQEGLGLALLPVQTCAAEVLAGTLTRVLPDWHEQERILYLVHVSRRAVMRSVRVVLDALVAGLQADLP